MNRYENRVWTIVLVFSLLGTSGCVKYYDLLPSEFPQAQKQKDGLKQASYAIRDVQFYSQFTTEAIFNVLWKSPRVNSLILDMYAERRGLSADRKEKIRDRNHESHEQSLNFFVLAYIKDTQRTDLNDQDATWTMYLKTADGHKLAPTKITMMDMTPELAVIFGKRNTNFKQLYFVKFPRKYQLNDASEVVVAAKKKKKVTSAVPAENEAVAIARIEPEPVWYDLMDQERLEMVINSVTLREEVSWPIAQHLVEDPDGEPLYMENESNNDEDTEYL